MNKQIPNERGQPVAGVLREAIILAGGLGTRLKDTVPDLPKCMAPVAGRPFLFYIINQLRQEGIEKFIFSLGHRHEAVEAYLAGQFPTLHYSCVVETEPLGTGGAIRLACTSATGKHIVVVNGDTIFRVNLQQAAAFHQERSAACTLVLKPMKNFERYGAVEMDGSGKVIQFREKQFYTDGWINGGVYLLDVVQFMMEQLPSKFSFEKDYLEAFYAIRPIFAQVQDAYFIDIGIPEDYHRAQAAFALPPPDLHQVDNTWTIFIDRDGVINHEKKDDYIRNVEEFRFYDGVKQAFEQLGDKFGKVVIVSNQRGVGRGLMTEEALTGIHRYMQHEIEAAGGRIDRIYYCTSTDKQHPDRKPNPGMAFRAAREVAGINLSKSMMVGNKPSDMLFGKNAGMYTVFLATTHPETPFPHPDIDLRYNSLGDFAKAL